MSKTGYSDIVALLEWAERQKKEPPKPDKKETDPISELLKFQRQFDEYQKFLKDQEKINKKEEKPKSGWDKMSFIQKMTVLTVTVPIAMMGHTLIVLLFAKAVLKMWGS